MFMNCEDGNPSHVHDKTEIIFKSIYRYEAISIQTQLLFFTEMDKFILQFIGNCKGPE